MRELSIKQKTFCENIVAGLNGKEAYIAAYNSKGSAQNAYNEASKLLSRDDITEYINRLRKPLETQIKGNLLAEREEKKRILWDIVKNPEEKTENQLRAIDILNRMDQDYLDKTDDDQKQDILDNIDDKALKDLININ